MLPLPLAVPKDAPRCQGLGPRVVDEWTRKLRAPCDSLASENHEKQIKEITPVATQTPRTPHHFAWSDSAARYISAFRSYLAT
jgi:hypothetical protein